MNRSSIRKSFLDDLLGESDSSATVSAGASASVDTRQQQQQHQRTKSVRFLEGDDDDDILGSLLPSPSSVPSSASVLRGSHDTIVPGQGSRGGSALLETPRRHEPATAKAASSTAGNSSDWLGLSEERPKTDPGRILEKGKVDQREEEDESRMTVMARKREFLLIKPMHCQI